MESKLLERNYVNSDLGVVNAARVSLAKESQLERVHKLGYEGCYYEDNINPICLKEDHYNYKMQPSDTKLISYLAKHNHWTPFSHASAVFKFEWEYLDALAFYHSYNPGGFSIEVETDVSGGVRNSYLIKGSLYSWINAIKAPCFTDVTEDYILEKLYAKYPISVKALLEREDIEPTFPFFTRSLEVSEEYLEHGFNPYNTWKILPATFLVRVPIFVARQIRTSQVGVAYSDLYVEGESFSFNETSRRYVNDEPSFYEIKQWRVREGSSIKQGSTGVVTNRFILGELKADTTANLDHAKALYEAYTRDNIAPEQLRSLLPQSMYTEFWMTATLHRWAQFIQLRSTNHVQEETREITRSIREQLANRYPQWAETYQL